MSKQGKCQQSEFRSNDFYAIFVYCRKESCFACRPGVKSPLVFTGNVEKSPDTGNLLHPDRPCFHVPWPAKRKTLVFPLFRVKSPWQGRKTTWAGKKTSLPCKD
jgi:hypothetical protein